MRLSVTELERVDELVHTCSKGNSLRVRKEYAGNQTASYIKEMNLQLQTLLIKKNKTPSPDDFLKFYKFSHYTNIHQETER